MKNQIKKLVQIQPYFTLIAFYNTPEHFIAAFRADIAGFLIFNPLKDFRNWEACPCQALFPCTDSLTPA
jgi:hypothetical protein